MTENAILVARWWRWARGCPAQLGGGVTRRALLSHIGSWLGVCGGGEPAGSVVEGWVVGRAGGARPPRAHR